MINVGNIADGLKIQGGERDSVCSIHVHMITARPDLERPFDDC